jgi:hypothetical protein
LRLIKGSLSHGRVPCEQHHQEQHQQHQHQLEQRSRSSSDSSWIVPNFTLLLPFTHFPCTKLGRRCS